MLLEVHQCVVDKTTDARHRANNALELHRWHLTYLYTKTLDAVVKPCTAELERQRKLSLPSAGDEAPVVAQKKLLATCLKQPVKTRPNTFGPTLKPCGELLSIMACTIESLKREKPALLRLWKGVTPGYEDSVVKLMAARSRGQQRAEVLRCKRLRKLTMSLLFDDHPQKVRDRSGWKPFLSNKQAAELYTKCGVWTEGKDLQILDQEE